MKAKQSAAIVVGHGSLHSDSGKSMIRIAARLREQAVAPIVEAGFLNYNRPTLSDAVEKATAQGATHFVIQPYFLIDGHYASRDLPALVQSIAAAKPACTFVLAETLGYHTALVQLVQKRVVTADPNSISHLTSGRALLLVAHGTPLEDANAPIYRVANKIGKILGYQSTTVAFLDCNQPSIPDAIEGLVAEGYRRIVIQPYFLHLGRHVRNDLPAIFARAQQDYPTVEIITAHHLDYDPLLVDVAAARIRSSLRCYTQL